MPKIDVDTYIEHCGMRKARFGGYEPEDVRQALQDLCAEYEQNLAAATSEARAARQENDALRRHAQNLVMQNQTLSTQNATLAGQVDKLQSYRASLETQYSTAKERNHSLTNQLDVLRLKNSDLTRENKELAEQCEEANAALRVKGRAHDQARQQAKDDADRILKDTNLKAEAIDQLAREQAIAQARKMVKSATDETREIQNAHRLRLQDLKSRITEMEKARGQMMDYLAQMIEELQKTQDYASRTAPLMPHEEELAEADTEPKLDLSANKVDAAASALRGNEQEPDNTPAEPQPAAATNRVVAPGMDEDEPRTNTVVTPSPDYFDTEPQPQSGDPDDKKEEIEIPGAIFSYPILRQQGEPILDEETPPQPVPHKPVMPSFTLADDEEDEPQPTPAAPAPQPAKPQSKRRRKAVLALRALRKKLDR